jgi:hypothetical protein
MKLPSVFRTATPMRYDIKPRYYDPIKEEIEQRTSRIKKELESEGILDPRNEEDLPEYNSGIKGSFAKYKRMKPRETSAFSSATLIRTFLFLTMVVATFGYIYIGQEIFSYLLYTCLIAAGIYFIFKLKNRPKDE